MAAPPVPRLPGAVLFACNLNRVRSPMAAALFKRRFGGVIHVDSCGLEAAEDADPLAVAAMAELGLDLSGHAPKTFEELSAGSFDLIVSLTQEAHVRASLMSRAWAVDLEHWPTADPTEGEGARGQRLELYRQVRDALDRRIAARFAGPSTSIA